MRYCIKDKDGNLSNGIVVRGTNSPPHHLIDQATEQEGTVIAVVRGSFPDASLHLCSEDSENPGVLFVDSAKVAAEAMRESLLQKAQVADQKAQLQLLRAEPGTTAEERNAIDSMVADLDAALTTEV